MIITRYSFFEQIIKISVISRKTSDVASLIPEIQPSPPPATYEILGN